MDYNKDIMFQRAAALAAKGWKIVRLWGVRNDRSCTCGNAVCKNAGKHPHGGPGWQHRATDSEEEILRWFDESHEHARSNIGVRLGHTSGIVDVEFDSKDAEEVLKKYGLDRIDTPSYSSGRGVHRFFQHEDWMPDSAVVKVEGLEVRIGGGETASQSVVPPSWHHTGNQYKWLPGKSPEDVNPAKLPSVFREAVISASRRQGSGITAQAVESLRSGQTWGEGERHPNLVGIASKLSMMLNHFTDAERQFVTTILLSVNATKCRPPKSEAEVIKIAHDQFAHYRDRQIERRANRPYERYGLVWNHEDRCWEPGQWRLTAVHVDPCKFKLRIPNLDRSLPPYIVQLSAKEFESARDVCVAILNETKKIDMNDPSASRWGAVWGGESVRDENGAWVNTRGLKSKLLADSDDEFPPPDHGDMASCAGILLSYLSDTQKIETGDDNDTVPNHSGSPKWIRGRDGEWRMWLKWQETFRLAWKKAGLLPPTREKEYALKERILSMAGEEEFRHQSREYNGRHGKWWLIQDSHIEILKKIAGVL